MIRIVELLQRERSRLLTSVESKADVGQIYSDQLCSLAAIVADIIQTTGAPRDADSAPHELDIETWSLWKDAVGGVVLRIEASQGVEFSLYLSEILTRDLFASLQPEAVDHLMAPHDLPAHYR
jgi:hypothetical protein